VSFDVPVETDPIPFRLNMCVEPNDEWEPSSRSALRPKFSDLEWVRDCFWFGVGVLVTAATWCLYSCHRRCEKNNWHCNIPNFLCCSKSKKLKLGGVKADAHKEACPLTYTNTTTGRWKIRDIDSDLELVKPSTLVKASTSSTGGDLVNGDDSFSQIDDKDDDSSPQIGLERETQIGSTSSSISSTESEFGGNWLATAIKTISDILGIKTKKAPRKRS